MGTRARLTVLDENCNVKIHQYGQYDNYPSAVGLNIVNILSNEDKKNKLKEVLKYCRFATQEEIETLKLEDNIYYNRITQTIRNIKNNTNTPDASISYNTLDDVDKKLFEATKLQWLHLWETSNTVDSILYSLISDRVNSIKINDDIILHNVETDDILYNYVIDFSKNKFLIDNVEFSFNDLPDLDKLKELE